MYYDAYQCRRRGPYGGGENIFKRRDIGPGALGRVSGQKDLGQCCAVLLVRIAGDCTQSIRSALVIYRCLQYFCSYIGQNHLGQSGTLSLARIAGTWPEGCRISIPPGPLLPGDSTITLPVLGDITLQRPSARGGVQFVAILVFQISLERM